MDMSDREIWLMFYGQVAGIQYHPANPPEQRQSLEDIADIIDEMLKIAKERTECL